MYKFHPWRFRHFHISYGIAWICLGVVGGLYISQYSMTIVPVFILIIVSLLTLIILPRLRWFGVIFVVLAGLMIGLWRGSQYAQLLAPLQGLSSKSLTLEAKVLEDPTHTARGDTRMVVGDIVIDGVKYPGSIWVSAQGESRVARDDIVAISGKSKPGFGTYQLMISYANVDIIKRSDDPLLKLRDKFSEAIRQFVVEPAASLGLGFVVGQKSALPANFEEQLRIVGLTHLVVASGFNLTILVRLAKKLFEKVSKYLVAYISVFLVSGFIVVSGASPSMVRAGIVAGLSMMAWYYGRRFHPMILILFAAAITGIIQPSYVWADIGWWLSFLAFFGVLVLSPILLKLITRGQENTSTLLQITVESFSAQVMTLPIIMMTFGSLSVIALLANIISAPFIPLAMLVTFLTGIVGMILPPLGMFFGVIAEIILSYFVAIVRHLSSPEWAQISLAISPFMMICIYITIGLIISLAAKKIRFNFRSQSIIE